MDILEMSDSKIYKLGIAMLVEHLGCDETTRFLSICKPREVPVEVSEQTLSHTEMRKIEKKIYKVYGTKPPAPHRDLSQMSDIAFYELALNIILEQLGPVGMMRFIRIRRPSTGDYTAERHRWLDKLDRKTILDGIQEVEKEIKATQIRHPK
ncbi:hypothetical protein F4009_02320 [Candidatus Poribacteria bacterium]|nr:hypothetical protein [Candidatus Poribacteria bacterium]MYH79253.1 hypothetical protein [Candidatus Poribacteria bacterium]MYK92836.1 hypothetical protein [Candidatus Poribacteria bacterium]